jgi:hypothetical protein
VELAAVLIAVAVVVACIGPAWAHRFWRMIMAAIRSVVRGQRSAEEQAPKEQRL